MTDIIPIARPVFDETDHAALRRPLERGWVVQGPEVAAFEADFAAAVGAPYAAGCSSATTALHLAMAALGVGPGDRVVVPAFTWVATANAVVYCGAEPVFADIDLDTFNIPAHVDVDDAKAVVPVHLFGLPAPTEFDALVIEDAACGLGARVGGQHVGTFGDAGCFSFHPRKAVTTGEGGMVVSAEAPIDATVRALRSHGAVAATDGRSPYVLAEFPYLGFNYRMTDLQGALGRSQMAKAERLHAARSALAERYRETLAHLDWLGLPQTPDGMTHGWQAFVCLYRPKAPTLGNIDALHADRNALMDALDAQGIQTRQGTHAVHALAYYRERLGVCPEDCPNAWIADRASLAIPLYPTMTEAEQDRVIAALSAWRPQV